FPAGAECLADADAVELDALAVVEDRVPFPIHDVDAGRRRSDQRREARLPLPHRTLGPAALRHVAVDGDVAREPALLVEPGPRAVLDLDRDAVPPLHAVPVPEGLLVPQAIDPLVGPAAPVPVERTQDLVRRLAEHFGGGPAVGLFGPAIPVDDPFFDVECDHGLVRDVEELRLKWGPLADLHEPSLAGKPGPTPQSPARRALSANATSSAAQVTRSSGSRSRLRRVQRRAASSVSVPSAAFSNASALGMKSNADQRRITA